MLPARYLAPITLLFHCWRLMRLIMRLSSILASDSFQASCRWINHEANSSDSILDIHRVNGLCEASETIASKCNIAFELYRTLMWCVCVCVHVHVHAHV